MIVPYSSFPGVSEIGGMEFWNFDHLKEWWDQSFWYTYMHVCIIRLVLGKENGVWHQCKWELLLDSSTSFMCDFSCLKELICMSNVF